MFPQLYRKFPLKDGESFVYNEETPDVFHNRDFWTKSRYCTSCLRKQNGTRRKGKKRKEEEGRWEWEGHIIINNTRCRVMKDKSR